MKKNGFTLIELLAVILILAIIALIAVPTVNSIIEESKRGAYKTTVQNLMDAVEKNCTTKMLNGEGANVEYNITDGKIEPKVEIKGTLPKSGTLKLNTECQVSEIIDLTDGDYIASYKDGKVEVTRAS